MGVFFLCDFERVLERGDGVVRLPEGGAACGRIMRRFLGVCHVAGRHELVAREEFRRGDVGLALEG